MIFPNVESLAWREIETKGGKQPIATMHVKFTVTDGTESREFVMVGEGQDSGDKATYKAMTGAQKYALVKLFLMSTGDDPESDSAQDAKAEPRAAHVSGGPDCRGADCPLCVPGTPAAATKAPEKPDNPQSLFIQLGGSYQACKGEEICGQVKIDR